MQANSEQQFSNVGVRNVRATDSQTVDARPLMGLQLASQVADRLNVSKAWVLEHARDSGPRPRIPSIKMGKAVRFRADDIDNFIEECRRRWQKQNRLA